ncbi:MAG: LptF/LptG family permease [Candidatus Margulisiibacteriota bacterium]
MTYRINAAVLSVLDRYIISEFLGPFVLGVAGFAIIGVVDVLFYLVELSVLSHVAVGTIVQMLLYKLPGVTVIFFPMAVLFSVMLLLVRMAKDNEITVLRSSGVPLWRLFLPLLVVTFGTTLLSFWINERVVPWANLGFDTIMRQQIEKKPPPSIIENVVFKDGDNRYFYVKYVQPGTAIMQDILVFEPGTAFPRILTAKTATWKNLSWTLKGGRIYDIEDTGDLQYASTFDTMTIHVDQPLGAFLNTDKVPSQMNTQELKAKIKTFKDGGINPKDLQVEYQMKWSIPLACFVFGVVGVAFCMVFVKSTKDLWGVVIAICLAVLTVGFYFFMVALFRAWGKEGALSPWLAVWMPNLVYLGAASGVLVYQGWRK